MYLMENMKMENTDSSYYLFVCNIAYLVPHCGLFSVLVAYLSIKLCFGKLKSNDRKRRVQYPAHTLRWICCVLMICVSVTAIVDGLLTIFDTFDDRTPEPAVETIWYTVSGCLSVGTIILLLYAYNIAESSSHIRILPISVIYWILVCVSSGVRVITLAWVFDAASVHFILVCLKLLLAIALVIFDANAAVKEHKDQLPTISVLPEIRFLHNTCSFFSQVTFHWMNSLFARGYKTALLMSDLGQLPEEETTHHSFNKFTVIIEEEKRRSKTKNKPFSLWRCLWLVSYKDIFPAGVCKLIADGCLLIPPLCLENIVKYVTWHQGQEPQLSVLDNTTALFQNGTFISNDSQFLPLHQLTTNGFFLSFTCLLSMLLYGFSFQTYIYQAARQGVLCKAAIQALVYNKTLKLASYSLSEGGMSQGSVVNHMSVDAVHVYFFFYWIHCIWSIPIQVLVITSLLYMQLGYSALLGSLIVILSCPLQYMLGSHLGKVQKQAMELADERLRQSTEMLQSIKLLKLYAWERIFCQRVLVTRHQELRKLLRAAVYRILSILVTDGAPVIACLVTYSSHPYLDSAHLSPGKVFSGLTLFNLLGVPLFLVPTIISAVSHARVSVTRLTHFLHAPQVADTQETLKHEYSNAKSPDGNDTVESTDAAEVQPLLFANKTEKDVTVSNSIQSGQSKTRNLVPNGSSTCATLKGDVSNAKDSCNPEKKNYENTLGACERSEEGTSEYLFQFDKCSYSWDGEGKGIVIKDVNFTVKKGELTMIVGPVASSKSSLLAAMLGEMTLQAGNMTKCSKSVIASAAQKAWLQNASLQENILFGRSMSRGLYEQVLDMCALRPDLAMLPAGDRTEIGEKGVNLSGGQKQRISIARAIYSQPDVILLDDPLSALDVHVGEQVFKEAIQKHLLCKTNTTVVLVTHQLQYLQHAHKIIALDKGSIVEQGTLSEIQTRNPDLYDTLVTDNQKNSPEEDQSCHEPTLDELSSRHVSREDLLAVMPPLRAATSALSLSRVDLPQEEHLHHAVESKGMVAAASTKEEGQLIEDEERETGSVSWRVYLAYARAATYTLTLGTLFGYVIRQAFRMLTDYWLAIWSEASVFSHNNNFSTNYSDVSLTSEDAYDLHYYIKGYSILSLVSLILLFLAIFFLELMSLNASRNLHSSMLNSVVAAPSRLFDVTPIGRIVNRLAGDTQILDEKMPVTWDIMLFCSLYVIGGIVMNMATNPWFIVPSLPVMAIYFIIQRFCIASSRELQRLDNMSKSPILSHFTETLAGLSTIRAYRCEKRFEEKNWAQVDGNNTTMLFLAAANSWMGLRLDMVGAVIVFTATLSSISSGVSGSISPGIAGIAIAYAIMISQFVNWMMRGATELEMFFNSVERQEYYAKIEPEKEPKQPVEVTSTWPSEGDIQLREVSLRYDESLDPVIHNIDLHIPGGSKVGVCGRTGSGKSSLTLGLFRLIQQSSGTITIDGVDTARVPLHTLRARLAIIPQDPVLFSASVRFNLDPESECSDSELWQALEQAQLRSAISHLDTSIAEGGANFSVGQRQLFCLARAILKKCRVLILDEATASVDLATDNTIQQVIQTLFSSCTVITIAHRVSTILNCDNIVVLQDGRILEQGSPCHLMERDSRFAAMVAQNN